MSEQREYTVEEVSKHFGVGSESVRKWIRQGKLKAEKRWGEYGWQNFISEDDLKEFEAQRKQHIEVIIKKEEKPKDQELITQQQFMENFKKQMAAEIAAALDIQIEKSIEQKVNKRMDALDQRMAERDRLLMEGLRQIQERQRLPWWKKLIGKK